MYRFDINTLLIKCIVVFVLYLPCLVFAADRSILSVLPAGRFAEDWAMDGKTTLYGKDTLFDHINGEAELYFPYGFEELATATYMNTKNPQSAVVVDVYRMASLLNAFGIYSNYRRADAGVAAIGAEGFVSSSQMMFYQDRYFVRIQAAGTTSIEGDILLACGRAVSKNLPPTASRPEELEVFRIPGIVPKTERYIAQSLLGYAFFHRGIIADAILEDDRGQIFLVPHDSKDAAREALDRYRSYLSLSGQRVQMIEAPDRLSMAAVDPLYGEVFVGQSGRYIIGAVRMKRSSTAKHFVQQMRERLGGG